MSKPVWILAAIGLIALSSESFAQEAGSCKRCVSDKVAGTAEEAAVMAAVGALGGGAAGGLPGAVCGAVIGAVGVGVTKLVQVAQCEQICVKEATARKDPDPKKCSDLMEKVKGK